MDTHRTLRFNLEEPLLQSAKAGEHNFIGLVVKTVERANIRVEFTPLLPVHKSLKSGPYDYSLTHMAAPEPKGLVFRRSYYYPFWQIDQTEKRWNWDVTRTVFDADTVASVEAKRFTSFWQKRLFGDAPLQSRKSGYVYVPLQGRLCQHRSFQSCSPIEMLEHTVAHAGNRKVIATLHPKESYTAQDLEALERLEKKHARLEIGMGDMERHLRDCDYVVTQNSSAAFAGYFFAKAVLLFAAIDFHHIAVKADIGNLAESFDAVAVANPDYAKYIWWFLQDQSINAGRDDAMDKIAARLRRFGWAI